MKRTSLKSGTFSRTEGSSLNKVAANMGRAAFFDPLTDCHVAQEGEGTVAR